MHPRDLSKIQKKTLVWFYAPWCGHCKNMKGEWARVERAVRGGLAVATVDGDEHGAFMEGLGIQGFPTIRLYCGAGGRFVEYEGRRKAEDILAFAERECGGRRKTEEGFRASYVNRDPRGVVPEEAPATHVERWDERRVHGMLVDRRYAGGVPVLLAVHDSGCAACPGHAQAMKAAARRFGGAVRLATFDVASDRSNAAFAKMMNVYQYPTFIVRQGGRSNAWMPRRDASSASVAADLAAFVCRVTGECR